MKACETIDVLLIILRFSIILLLLNVWHSFVNAEYVIRWFTKSFLFVVHSDVILVIKMYFERARAGGAPNSIMGISSGWKPKVCGDYNITFARPSSSNACIGIIHLCCLRKCWVINCRGYRTQGTQSFVIMYIWCLYLKNLSFYFSY